jgi:hypothetical protein
MMAFDNQGPYLRTRQHGANAFYNEGDNMVAHNLESKEFD